MTSPDSATPTDERERRAILLAMDRLLGGQTTRKLTVKDLAEEAGVKRHCLTQKHTDLKDLFYRRVAESGEQQEPAYVLRLRERIADLEQRLRQRAEDVARLKALNDQYVENLAVAVAAFDKADRNWTTAEERVDALEMRLTAAQERIDELEPRAQRVAGGLARLRVAGPQAIVD